MNKMIGVLRISPEWITFEEFSKMIDSLVNEYRLEIIPDSKVKTEKVGNNQAKLVPEYSRWQIRISFKKV